MAYFIENLVEGSFISDLDSEAILSYLRVATALDESAKFDDPIVLERILGQKIAIRQEDKTMLTIGGVLTFAKDPQRFLPYCGIIFARYPGTTLAITEFTSHTFQSTISQNLSAVADMITASTQKSEIQGMKRLDTTDYPINVVREVLVNALIHRDYEMTHSKILVNLFSDRLEVKSPGLPPNGLTIENMKAGYPVHRNPLLSNYVRYLGLGEQSAGGLPRIINQMRLLNREINIEFEGPWVKVTIEAPKETR